MALHLRRESASACALVRIALLVVLTPALVQTQNRIAIESEGPNLLTATTGELEVTSVPSGASVTIDGKARGLTPLLISGLTPESHRVTLLRQGYLENSRVVPVSANKQAHVRVALTPAPTAGPLAAQSNEGGGGGSKKKWLIPLLAGGGVAATLGVLKGKSDDPPPSGTITVSPTGAGLVGVTVFSLSAGVTGGTSPFTYAWDFGDGQSASGQAVTHTYGTVGGFTVNLTVTDAKGLVATSQFSGLQIRSMTAGWNVAISPAPSTSVLITFTQNLGVLSAALNDTVSTGLRTGTGTGSVADPKSITATVTYAVGPSVSSPFSVVFTATGDTPLNTFTGTATGYAGCPCAVTMTRQ